MDSVQLLQVIAVQCDRGFGRADDPIRTVFQYWSLDGRLLAERDEINESEY